MGWWSVLRHALVPGRPERGEPERPRGGLPQPHAPALRQATSLPARHECASKGRPGAAPRHGQPPTGERAAALPLAPLQAARTSAGSKRALFAAACKTSSSGSCWDFPMGPPAALQSAARWAAGRAHAMVPDPTQRLEARAR